MRDPAKRVGLLTRHTSSIDHAAGAIHWFVLSEGPQSVFVNGRSVYALPQATLGARRMLDAHPAWWLGNYAVDRCNPAGAIEMRHVIASDLRVRAMALRAMA